MDPDVLARVAFRARADCGLVQRKESKNPFGQPQLGDPGSPWEYFYWYHGTNNPDAVRSIISSGYFDPAAGQRVHGGMYGTGLYLARTACIGRAYGEYVFTVTLDGMHLLRVTSGAPARDQLAAHVPALGDAERASLSEALRVSAASKAPIDIVSDWARASGYDGLYLLNVAEGTLVTIFTRHVPITGLPFRAGDRCVEHGS